MSLLFSLQSVASKFAPLLNRVLVEKVVPAAKSAGGILLPSAPKAGVQQVCRGVINSCRVIFNASTCTYAQTTIPYLPSCASTLLVSFVIRVLLLLLVLVSALKTARLFPLL